MAVAGDAEEYSKGMSVSRGHVTGATVEDGK